MSFFQGMAQAFKDADDQRFRMKVLGEEQGFIRERDEAGRQHDREMRMMEIATRRQEALLQATAGRSARGGSGGSGNTAGRASVLALAGLIGEDTEGRDDFLANAFLTPEVAADLVDRIEKANERRAAAELPPLSGAEIIQASRVYGIEIPDDALTPEEIFGADVTDPAVFEELYGRATAAGGQDVALTFTPPAIGPSVATYNAQVEAVKANIISILSSQLSATQGQENTQLQTELQSLLNGIQANDPVAMNMALREYGMDVVSALKEQGSALMAGVEQNPMLRPIFTREAETPPAGPVQDLATPTTPMVSEPAGEAPTASPAPTEERPSLNDPRRIPLQQDFNSMEEAQAFLQTLPPGFYRIMVNGQELPATVE